MTLNKKNKLFNKYKLNITKNKLFNQKDTLTQFIILTIIFFQIH